MAALRDLADTNILVRLAKRHDPACSLVRGALRALLAQSACRCDTPQTMAEFWNVSTRHPLDRSMVLFHNVVEIFDLADVDRGAVLRMIASDSRRIGLAAIDGDRLGHAMTADRLRMACIRRA